MKNVSYLLVIASLLVSEISFGQKAFNNCSAAFLNNKLVVDEYTPKGKCSMSATTVGTLTVCTADLSPVESKPKEKILFRIAIRDMNTKTLVMFSDKAYKEVDIQKVMKKCASGDQIILLTTDSQYALPHNEIQVL